MKRFIGHSAHISILVASLLCTCSQVLSQDTKIKMTDISKETGIGFVHNDGGSGLAYLVESMASGLATFDYNNDGLVDIYFLNGNRLKGTPDGPPLRNALYRNDGNMKFTDVTETAGVGDEGFGLGVSAADYNGDGYIDMYINNFGANVLYKNNGDDTFTDVTAEAGVANGDQLGAGVSFLDSDGDGDLDLYVGNYVDFTYENHVEIIRNGRRFHAGPQYYRPIPDTFYRNNGDGTFTDISQESGIASVVGPSMGVVSADFDKDGDTDIYICNDGDPNFLLDNDGTGHFEDVAVLSGIAFDFNGSANSSMGVDIGDYDNDGKIDFATTTYQNEMPVLYHNLGDGIYEDATSIARITESLLPHVNWGISLVDFDNDGDLDLFIACGHFDEMEVVDDRTSYRIRNYLLENVDGSFSDVTAVCGSGLAPIESSRGAAFEDFDNDGDVDAVILNANAAPTVIRNDSEAADNHWIELHLSQGGMNPSAIGAKVSLKYEGAQRLILIGNGKGYQSHYGDRIHVGLGAKATEATATVTWPDGSVSEHALDLNKLNTLEKP